MKASEIKVNGVYIAMVSGRLTEMRVDEIRDVGYPHPLARRNGRRYHVTNLATGRKTTFRSTAKFRREAKKGARDANVHETVATVEQPRSGEPGPARPSSDGGSKVAESRGGRPAAQGPGGLVEAQVGSSELLDDDPAFCPDSPDEKHSFTADMEYYRVNGGAYVEPRTQ